MLFFFFLENLKSELENAFTVCVGCLCEKSAWEAIRSHTEHGHVLLAMQVPVAPVGPVAVKRGVLLVVVGGLGAEGVDHADVAPGTTQTG